MRLNESEFLTDDERSTDQPRMINSTGRQSLNFRELFDWVIKWMYFLLAVYAFYKISQFPGSHPAQQLSEGVQKMVVDVLNEHLKSNGLTNEGLQVLVERILSEQMESKCSELGFEERRSAESLLERNEHPKNPDVNLNILNDAIRTQLKEIIREKNFGENVKPDYASELNNAIVLAASNTFVGKKD